VILRLVEMETQSKTGKGQGTFHRLYLPHIQEAIGLDDEPPLSSDERRRRIVLLCCTFMRNLAFHRAGREAEPQRELLIPEHPQGAFWREVHGNFFDICVLDWCKLFADHDGQHHWQRVVDNLGRFEPDLYAELGVTADEFATLVKNIKHYRDKFVAHLDKERTMLLPDLEVAERAIAFLHERLLQQADIYEGWLGLPTTAEQFKQGYAQAFSEAQRAYDEALARCDEKAPRGKGR
jgi:hypothetical protein